MIMLCWFTLYVIVDKKRFPFCFQVADVAQAIVNAVNNDESIGQTFELTG